MAQNDTKEAMRWVYLACNIEDEAGQCSKLLMTNVFPVYGINEYNLNKKEQLIKEELSNTFSKKPYDTKTIDNMLIKSFEQQKDANDDWQKRYKGESDKAKFDDSGKNCEPITYNWKYSGERYFKETNYSIFEDGWSILKDSVRLDELSHLNELLKKNLGAGPTEVVVREKPLPIFENGKLIEYSIKSKENQVIIYNRLYANDTAYFLDPKKSLKNLQNEHPFLFNDEDVITYLKLAVNLLEDSARN
ncbi:MAG: hypothetical protein KDC52_18140, partial [Ignavibacteriae bacterium]|nr:hypothetical protein [Ignavibacteriota bacterium]